MQSNGPVRLANIRMLQFIATKLGALCDEVVFLGGCTTALFINDPEAPDVRYTFDVDCIIDVLSLNQYHHLEKKLKTLGFKQSISEEVINRWYKEAILNSNIYSLPDSVKIKAVTAPYFLATKLEAFKTRGKFDFYASRDFEDIVSVLDGRAEIVDEITIANEGLKDYLIQALAEINSKLAFKGAIPGHFVQYGNLAEDRIQLLEQNIKTIIKG